jgi:aspartate aminotransferase
MLRPYAFLHMADREKSMNLAKRLQLIKPSPTLMVTVKVAALRREGIEVIDFGAGEPDFDTPDHIKEAAVTALKQGKTKYTPVGGTAELKEAIIANSNVIMA